MTFQFKIKIEGISKPPVWRRVLVPGHYTMHQLHLVIQAIFGWEDYHLYQFSEKDLDEPSPIVYKIPDEFDDEMLDEEIVDSREVTIDSIFNDKSELLYIYDYGDNWTHKITREKVIGEPSTKAKCLTGKGCGPPEDVGGSHGYEQMKEALRDKKNPEHKSYLEWLGLKKASDWDIDFPYIGEANENLRNSGL